MLVMNKHDRKYDQIAAGSEKNAEQPIHMSHVCIAARMYECNNNVLFLLFQIDNINRV